MQEHAFIGTIRTVKQQNMFCCVCLVSCPSLGHIIYQVENELVPASSSFPATIIIIIVLCILELWHVTQRSNIVGFRNSFQFDVLTHRGVVLKIGT